MNDEVLTIEPVDSGYYAESVEAAVKYIRSLDPRQRWRLWAESAALKRRDQANKLMWHWNGELAAQRHITPRRQHAEWKHDVLLPLLKTWDKHHARAMYVQEMLDLFEKRGHALMIVYETVRSKDLTIKEFAKALDAYRLFYTEKGLVMTDRQDLLAEIYSRTIHHEDTSE